MSSESYDIVFVGAGAAGLHTAISLVDEDSERRLRIALVDPDEKSANDRTWCFWEEGPGRWDDILTREWTDGTVRTPDGKEISLDMGRYRYKMLCSSDFYQEAKDIISQHPGIDWIRDDVVSVEETEDDCLIRTNHQELHGKTVLDSRVPESFLATQVDAIRILQHFVGWVVEYDEAVFDQDRFVMMDFHHQASEDTAFFYLLPLDEKRALVEYTLFNHEVSSDQHYEDSLKAYLTAHLPNLEYRIVEQEKGVIPMSDFAFHMGQGQRHIRIGTAGGWVKPATGYHFRFAQRFGGQFAKALANGNRPSVTPWSKRHRYYDGLLLDILDRDNELGPRLFGIMYSKMPAHLILRFLDEDTSFLQDLRVMSKFPPMPFIKSLVKRLFS